MPPQMNIDSIIEEENAEKEKLERAREEAAEKVLTILKILLSVIS